MIVKRARGLGTLPLDLPMAALAAVSVAFVAYAMPDALLADAVGMSGLPAVLPAAQPPLGMTARLAVVAASAITAFVGTWLLLHALNRPAPARRARSIVADEVPTLRLRRADAHPDAPSRRPLIAGLDLGEPDAEAEAPEAEEVPEDQPLPTFLVAENEMPLVEPAAAMPAGEQEAEPEAAPPLLELEEPTIASLMQRLELGLAGRRGTPAPAPVAEEPAAPPPATDPIDERLRNALGELRRLAARGN